MSRLKEMFKKNTYRSVPQKEKNGRELSVPEGLWVKCAKCGKTVYKEDVTENSYTCPKCGGYFRIKTRTRLRLTADEGSFQEWGTEIADKDPLNYPGYGEKLSELRQKTHLQEAVTIGYAKLGGCEAVLGVCDARFLMGSMGYVVGERITEAIEEATRRRLPVVLFCCSGGARMQEGIVSLMQMAKTAAAIKRHSDAGLLYLSVLTDPTMGGVTASFAMLGDIILAEPGALIGFAGPRVIAQTIGEKIPEGFQRTEFLLEKGMIDAAVERKELKDVLVKLLTMHSREHCEESVEKKTGPCTAQEGSSHPLTAWERVQISRSSHRPTSLDYIQEIFTDFLELHGDRSFRDDGAIVGGIALLDGRPVTVIGQQKGRSTKENLSRNFGMASPEGYRKALRLARQAEKFHRPVICFVDTSGAYPGVAAEERGVGEAIARSIVEFMSIKTPVITIILGEGGSGGAIAMCVCDELAMLENAIYSVISPRGFASILWKDASREREAADIMKITAEDLVHLKVCDYIIEESAGGAHTDPEQTAENISEYISCALERNLQKGLDEMLNGRYNRYRAIGEFDEGESADCVDQF